jgi:hypothetical protein
MKKTYKLLPAIIGMIGLGTPELGAQALSGVYTIDQTAMASATNFTSFASFAAALNTNGVSGPVTANVASGTGPYTEQVLFTSISGASSNNRIVINGNDNLITYASASSGAYHTIGLNGTDFLTIDDLNIQATGTYAYALTLWGGADFNMFSNCTFSVNPNTTSSLQVPVVISGSGTSWSSSGNSGSNNSFSDCQMFSGYYCTTMYGPTSSPRDGNNTFTRCSFEDFYFYGVYSYYHWEQTFKNNVFSRPTRTSLSSCYNLMLYYSQGSVVDGNIAMKPFGANPTSSSLAYGFYVYSYFNPLPSDAMPNIIRNNIVTDFRSNGTQYGIYSYGNHNVYHNTISLDNTGSTSGGTDGIRAYVVGNQSQTLKNNNISITRGGSGTKYGIYIGSSGDITSDYNNIYVNSSGGTNYYGYDVGSTASSFAAWQSMGYDVNGSSMDPVFASLPTNDLHPTNTLLNNTGTPVGVLFDQENFVRHQTTPDVGALEFLTPMCTGTPSTTVLGPTYSLCPGESADVVLGNLSSDLGYTYTWFTSSFSQVGPWSPLMGNSITNAVPNVTATTWVSAVISCTAPGGSSVQPVSQINVASPTTSVVPYYENFEGIGLADRLPNCSWSAPSLGSGARTYVSAAAGNLLPNSGNAFAAFTNNGAGTAEYYTNGIYLNANVTYSASLWYMTDFSGGTNWTDLSIHFGTSQSTSGLTQIASAGPAVSAFYKPLSNVFTVPTSGMYYVAIKATSSGPGANNLVWDDLRIEIPCSPQYNMPNLSLSANVATICSGESVILNAGGADTYVWSTGATGPATTEYPVVNTVFTVIGTNTVTGCSVTKSVPVTVNKTPNVFAFAIPPVVCEGDATTLQSSGAITYTWNNNVQGSNISVIPTSVINSFSVMGTGANGCVGKSNITVGINQLPNVVAASAAVVCANDPVTLIGNGASTYEWKSTSPAAYLIGQNIVTTLNQPVTFTLTGTDLNGCKDTDVFSIVVQACTGIDEAGRGGFSVFPNPTTGVFSIDLASGQDAVVTVSDMTGRVICTANGTGNITADISSASAGVYTLRIQTNESSTVKKIVKQ